MTVCLDQTLKLIKENPEHWDQSVWHCSTSHCFWGFGHLIYLGVIDPDNASDDLVVVNEDDDLSDDENIGDSSIFGLTKKQGDLLFECENTLEDLANIVDLFKGRVEHILVRSYYYYKGYGQ